MSTNTENAEFIELRNNINMDNKIIKEKVKIKELPYFITKRVVDIIGALVGLIFLVPITLVIYIARKILKEDDGPIFYEHLRYGKNGKQFRMYKFRSMCMNADEKLNEYLEENEEARKEYQEFKKLVDDPRITKVGKVLRKGSIDEFPQFLNVLKGEMSLVGPRPYLIREREDMGEYFELITSVKPGITGYWQITGRSDVTFKDRLKMEKNYVENKSILLDLKILLKTVIKILKKEGAM